MFGQMGRKWPSEKKIVPDPVTGVPLTFLTSTDGGNSQSKIYQTHRQWTADGKWLIFRGSRATGSQAFAVNEETGDIVQVTESGFSGMLCAGNKTMKLYVMLGGGGRGGTNAPADRMEAGAGADTNAPGARAGRGRGGNPPSETSGSPGSTNAPGARGGRGGGGGGPRQILEIDLEKLFADVAAKTVKPASNYTRVCGTTPPGLNADGNMGLDANDDFMYFRVNGPETADLSPGQTLQQRTGPRSMGAGPSGLRSMNLKTGEIKMICNVGFQIGHVQSNPWMPGEIVFCWETGGKAPQRTWFVNADGSGLRPLYPEAPYEWITHEAVIGKDEVAIAILGHRNIASAMTNSDWGVAGTFEHPTGVGIVNLRTREMRIAGQVPAWASGRSDWHVAGSADGRWAACDDFSYQVWLMDRHNGETILLAGPQKRGADHIHPTFNADGTKIEIQSALISTNNRALNICVVPIPKSLLDRTYPQKLVQ
jgi:oligogalacturonide lyase